MEFDRGGTNVGGSYKCFGCRAFDLELKEPCSAGSTFIQFQLSFSFVTSTLIPSLFSFSLLTGM